ncbi:MAG: DNA-processing protein DprA [Gammaproteobacteria bacterium]|nr:DNA-processing protein DprA [Gammaproteobacteria bacterium]MBP9729621.1 DNA-processing protein DprA [Gammaproteobacteria bacterium]
MDNQNETLPYILALLRIPGVGPISLAEALEAHPDPRTLFDSRGYCTWFKSKADWSLVDKDLAWAQKPDCSLLSLQDPNYPSLLSEIHSAPPLLFVQGNRRLLSQLQIAIVGSRNPSYAGLENALQFGKYFSGVRLTVTSGLALGIDAAAHKGALLGVGQTIAVLGNGLDQIYPSAHKNLAQQIIDQGGALVSEFPIGTPPLPGHFPRRNRIISGLTVGTLVIEAALNSGSLITAKYALEQGREVFAVPGSIHSPLVKGCHALIREGAKLVETAEHVVEELGSLKGYVACTRKSDKASRETRDSLGSAQESLLQQVGYECTPMESILQQSRLTAKLASSMLLELELQGYVCSVPGGYARLLA